MLRDYIIPKPATIGPYGGHQLVAELTDDAEVLFCDQGDALRIRTDAALPINFKTIIPPSTGDVLGFELRASCGGKSRGRHRYYPHGDWRSRRAWLDRKASENGFEVLAVTVTSRSVPIQRKERTFRIDQSDFMGVLRVVDSDAFARALRSGVGSTGKAFGHSMLVI